MIRRVKGTQDLLNMKGYDTIVQTARQHMEAASFHHIQTPILEPAELFMRAIGDQTDIVSKEMYTLSTNQKEVLCLRPELTASTLRAYFEAKLAPQLWKVFSFGPLFRHERPQKGRWRQFSQFNSEMIGVTHIAQHAEFLFFLNDYFERVLNLFSYTLELNYLGSSDDRSRHKEALYSFLQAHNKDICQTCLIRKESNILRVFDCKIEECKALYQKAPLLTDYLCNESQEEWEQLQWLLNALSISFVHNPFLVRGLDYYNKTVFEFTSHLLGAQAAFGGGGAYDLSHYFNYSQPLECIGAGIGIERILLILEALASPLLITPPLPHYCVAALGKEQEPLALLALQALHRAGLHSELLPTTTSLSKALKKADKRGATQVILIGEDEQEKSTILVKSLTNGTSTHVSHEHLISFLKETSQH